MKVEFITNASVVIHLSNGKTILVDPWWRGSAFYGSWYNFPPVGKEDRERYEALAPDAIFISHAHPDHLHPETLQKFPISTPILIAELPHKHLVRGIQKLGFSDIRSLEPGVTTDFLGAEVAILADFGLSSEGFTDDTGYVMDNSLFVRDPDGTSVLHIIDNAIQPEDARKVREQFGAIDIAILPYAGASFFPHAFFRYSEQEKREKRDAISSTLLDSFCKITGILQPKCCVPAAGSYVMGGRISDYSHYLHQATPSEIKDRFSASGFSGTRLCMLATGDKLDAATATVEQSDSAPFRDYTNAERATYAIETLTENSLPQDLVEIPSDFALPWGRLLDKAKANQQRMQAKLDVFPSVDVILVIAASNGVDLGGAATMTYTFALDESCDKPATADAERMAIEFRLDASILLMILLGGAIWDNVEIAALVECARAPDVHDPTVHSLMSYFSL